MTKYIINSASVSVDCNYRYSLYRLWGTNEYNIMCFCMLNPSTADATQDDNTIRRCVGFARREGFDGVFIINLFGLRATDPKELTIAIDPIGMSNSTYWNICTSNSKYKGMKIVCAWGGNKFAQGQARNFMDICNAMMLPVFCLGTNKDNSPKHPLYLPNDTPLIPYRSVS